MFTSHNTEVRGAGSLALALLFCLASGGAHGQQISHDVSPAPQPDDRGDDVRWPDDPAYAEASGNLRANYAESRIDEKPYGERIVHLDNGQVWEENSRNRNLPLDVGDSVTIKSAAFGSYKLIGPGGKRFTRVRRIG